MVTSLWRGMDTKEDVMEDCAETKIAVEREVEEVDMNDIGFQKTLTLIPCEIE
jgi:hypothetical protein